MEDHVIEIKEIGDYSNINQLKTNMNTKVFDNDYVGYKLNDIKQVVNAMAAGMQICNADGYYFDERIEVTDPETGEETDRDPTDEEIMMRIQEAMQNEYDVYASFYLDCGKVVDDKMTTLQSDFYVGQIVYFMSDNKISKGTIVQIDFAHFKKGSGCITKERYHVRYDKMDNFTPSIILSSGEFFVNKEGLVKYLETNIKTKE